MKCDKHRKDHVGGCMWCGKRLCEFCVAKREGVKLYCDKCIDLLCGVRRDPLPNVGRQPLPSAGRRFVIKNGYLEMDGEMHGRV
jgi:hypothetical protein